MFKLTNKASIQIQCFKRLSFQKNPKQATKTPLGLKLKNIKMTDFYYVTKKPMHNLVTKKNNKKDYIYTYKSAKSTNYSGSNFNLIFLFRLTESYMHFFFDYKIVKATNRSKKKRHK